MLVLVLDGVARTTGSCRVAGCCVHDPRSTHVRGRVQATPRLMPGDTPFGQVLAMELVSRARHVAATLPPAVLVHAAAERLAAGGTLLVASNAPGFVSEAIVKGAGLILTQVRAACCPR